ncbi:hypothetical protein MKY75_11395 [Paenibacillus sp. FSL L8-0663]
MEQVIDTIGHHSCMVRQGFILPGRAKHAILIVAGEKCQDRQQEVSASVL